MGLAILNAAVERGKRAWRNGYTASKVAVNAFTESLTLELAPFGIEVKIVLPGAAPETSFGSTAISRLEENGGFPAPYAEFANAVIAAMRTSDAPQTPSSDVADAIWRAATIAECMTESLWFSVITRCDFLILRLSLLPVKNCIEVQVRPQQVDTIQAIFRASCKARGRFAPVSGTPKQGRIARRVFF
jgi:hypothetical protein